MRDPFQYTWWLASRSAGLVGGGEVERHDQAVIGFDGGLCERGFGHAKAPGRRSREAGGSAGAAIWAKTVG